MKLELESRLYASVSLSRPVVIVLAHSIKRNRFAFSVSISLVVADNLATAYALIPDYSLVCGNISFYKRVCWLQ
jgi:hypothetical protein